MATAISRAAAAQMRSTGRRFAPGGALDEAVKHLQANCESQPWRWEGTPPLGPVFAPALKPGSSLWRASPSEVKDLGLWGLDGPYCFWVWPGAWAACDTLQASPELLDGVDVVVDLGCGGGIIGLAAAALGCRRVVLNDICPVALVVSAGAAELNGVAVAGTSTGVCWGGTGWDACDLSLAAGAASPGWEGAWLEARSLITSEGEEQACSEDGAGDVAGTSASAHLEHAAPAMRGVASSGGSEAPLRVLIAAGDVMYDCRSASAVTLWCEALARGEGPPVEALRQANWLQGLANGRGIAVDVLAASPRWPAAQDDGPAARGWTLRQSLSLPASVASLCHGLEACDVWYMPSTSTAR